MPGASPDIPFPSLIMTPDPACTAHILVVRGKEKERDEKQRYSAIGQGLGATRAKKARRDTGTAEGENH
jgi:hypothetical protein